MYCCYPSSSVDVLLVFHIQNHVKQWAPSKLPKVATTLCATVPISSMDKIFFCNKDDFSISDLEIDLCHSSVAEKREDRSVKLEKKAPQDHFRNSNVNLCRKKEHDKKECSHSLVGVTHKVSEHESLRPSLPIMNDYDSGKTILQKAVSWVSVTFPQAWGRLIARSHWMLPNKFKCWMSSYLSISIHSSKMSCTSNFWMKLVLHDVEMGWALVNSLKILWMSKYLWKKKIANSVAGVIGHRLTAIGWPICGM